MADIKELFKRYQENNVSEEELRILLQYFESKDHADPTIEMVQEELLQGESEIQLSSALEEIVARNRAALQYASANHTGKQPRDRKIIYRWVSVAASVLLVAVAALYYFQVPSPYRIAVVDQQDVEPGTNRATLTLDNGQAFDLNEDLTGIVMDADEIRYTDGSDVVRLSSAQYAKLSTPRKGQYKVNLPDGTRVWLNAESSLRYPTHFGEGERHVELVGEAYFDVVPDPLRPFVVQTSGQRLKVLGTSFNVNAYTNEQSTVTTLISGSVELNGGKRLQPAQQAVLTGGSYLIQKDIDVRAYTAWKEGEFRFKATPLPEAVRQLERWYDIEVDYAQIPQDIRIHASIRRDKKLSSVLYALEEISGLTFEIKGRRLTLMK